MTNKIAYISTALAITFSLSFFACDSGNNKKSDKPKTENKTSDIKEFQNIIYTKYNIPLPVDLFKYMIGEEIPYNVDLPNSSNNVSQYTTATSQALALGGYAADIAYCSMYNKQQEVMEYFNAANTLADKLDIAEGFTYKYIERLESNINSADSLSNIASESYWKACNYLDENGKNNILPFIVYSGWVESQYLTIASNNLPTTRKQIAAQKEGLVNLIKYLYEVMVESTAYYYTYDIKIRILQLNNLRDVFDKIPDTDIDSEIYKDIAAKITAMRNDIVKP